MKLLIVINIVFKIVAIILLIIIFVKVNSVIKNQISIMASLSDFQAQAARIDAATQSIKDIVSGQGMSAADSDAALKVIQDSVDNLTSAIPTPPTATP